MTQSAPTQVETQTPLARRPGPWKIDDIVELRAVKSRIDTALSDNITNAQAARKVVLDQLEQVHFRGRMIAQERLQQGADGLDTAQLLSGVQDVIIRGICHFISRTNSQSDTADSAFDFGVIATGGYGRCVLAPNSDVDLLFLTQSTLTPASQNQIESILYCLWDLKLKIGYATRNISECIKLANEDVSIKTALLDARLIFGDRTLFGDFKLAYDAKIRGQGRERFIEEKLAERDAYHTKTGHSPFVVEPHIKEGMGGLRDLQTLFWINKFYHGGEFFDDVFENGGLSITERRIFREGARFLWTVRCHLHFMTGRAEDRLNFDVQPEIARRMYYKDRGDQLGVERFMKRYFLLAREIGILMRVLLARLSAERTSARGGVLSYLGQTLQATFIDANLPKGFEYVQNNIQISDFDALAQYPENLVKVFLLERDTENPIHPETFLKLRSAARRLQTEALDSQDLCDAVLDAITGPRVEEVLRRLTEADILGRLIPEFGKIIAQTQFNMYHHYTIDEHTLRAVGGLADMEAGKWPVAKAEDLFKQISNRRALYLAMLLHDTGKGLGDQQVLGEQTSMAACRRLGLDEAETTLVGWLVRNHLEMSEVAQKRDISDPRTISDFVARVKTTERLNLLYLLTCADINAVGSGVFNTWKGQLLAELHGAATSVMRGGRTDEASISQQLQTQAENKKSLCQAQFSELPAQLANIEPAYWLSTDYDSQMRHATWLAGLNTPKLTTHLTYDPISKLGELIVTGSNEIGVFSKIVQAIGVVDGDIITAHAFSDADNSGRYFDVFSILLPSNYINQDDLQRWNDEIYAIITAPSPTEPRAGKVDYTTEKRQAAFIVMPEVFWNNDLSSNSTILEISAVNEKGVLSAICDVIFEHNFSILSAHIASFGERVFDVFYVQDADGNKLTDIDSIHVFKVALIERLEAFGQGVPRTAIRELERSEAAKSY